MSTSGTRFIDADNSGDDRVEIGGISRQNIFYWGPFGLRTPCVEPIRELRPDVDGTNERRGHFKDSMKIELFYFDGCPNYLTALRKLNAAKGGGYIFQSDHSVAGDVSGQTYDYIVKLVREYGNYPLDLGEYNEHL